MIDGIRVTTDVLQTALVAFVVASPLLMALALSVRRYFTALGPEHPRDNWR